MAKCKCGKEVLPGSPDSDRNPYFCDECNDIVTHSNAMPDVSMRDKNIYKLKSHILRRGSRNKL